MDVQAHCDGEAARWVFTDQGEGFDVAGALHRLENEEPDPWRPSGRGLFLMRAFVDEMRYEDRGRRLTLTLHRSSGTEKRAHPASQIAREVRSRPHRRRRSGPPGGRPRGGRAATSRRRGLASSRRTWRRARA